MLLKPLYITFQLSWTKKINVFILHRHCYCMLDWLNYLQAKVIIINVIVISQLFTDSLSISRIKSIITYCSPLSITVDLHTSFIRIITSLETYHTIERIIVPDSSSIYTNMIMLGKYLYSQQYTVASLVLIHPRSMDVSKEHWKIVR